MDSELGLRTSLWGIEGTTWRKADVLAAQSVMARSFGHFISSGCHAASRALTEFGFPVAVAAMAVAGALSSSNGGGGGGGGGEGEGAAAAAAAATKAPTTEAAKLLSSLAGSISLGACSKILLLVVTSAAAIKALAHRRHVREHARLKGEQQRRLKSFWSVSGGEKAKKDEDNSNNRKLLLPPAPLPASPRPFFPHATTPEEKRRLQKAGLSISLGLLFFPLPEFFPRLYFLFHSLWHLAMAFGIHSLYCLIEKEEEPALPDPREGARVVAAAAVEAGAALRRLVLASSRNSSLSSLRLRTSLLLRRPSSSCSRRRQRSAAARQHLQQQGAVSGGHRRVLSVIFEATEEEEVEEDEKDREEEEEETSSFSSSSSSSLSSDDNNERGKEAAAAEEASSTSSSLAPLLSLSTAKLLRRWRPNEFDLS